MKKISSRRGSALLIAVVIVILTAGIGGAFLALSAGSQKDTFLKNQNDDAQQICDAGLEMARAALLKWRNLDQDPIAGQAVIPPDCYAWNKLFSYCASVDAVTATAGMGASADPDVIRKDAMAKFKDVSNGSWSYSGDKDSKYPYNYDTTNTPGTLGDIGSSTSNTIGTGVSDLFCINRRYGKGAFHLAFKNNTGDKIGDGIDNKLPEPSGNPWGWDGPQPVSTYDPVTQKYVDVIQYPGDTLGGPYNAGFPNPMIDGDGQAILVVTATLPDGTCHQIEVLLSYPFKGTMFGGAINDNGDISMQGNFRILGTMGSVFANGNVTGNGSAGATITGSVSAAGDASGLKMQNQPGGGIKSQADPIPIAPVNIPDFLTDPKYANLQSNMIVLHKDGTMTKNGSPISVPMVLKNGTWSISGKTAPPNAVYYVEGDFKMTGQGNAASYQMSVIATGSVELGGNSAFAAATDSSGKSVGSLVVAGADIKLAGTGYSGGPQYSGQMFANEQIAIKGTFDLEGSITGANATDSPGSIVSSTSQLSDPDLTIGGTPTIIYNGGASIVKPNADHLDVKSMHRTRSIAGGIVKYEK